MRARRITWIIGLIGLAGCGTVGDLEKFQDWQAKGQFESIATEPVPSDCTSEPFASEACPKIYAIRGRACLELARRETAPSAACPPVNSPKARQWLECAVDSYGKAKLTPADPAEAVNLGENRARALYCAARLRSPAEGAAMAREAQSQLSRLPPNPERDLLAASSALFVAQQEQLPPADRCPAARQAATLASRGLTGSPPPDANLANALRGSQTAATLEAANIPGCGGR